MAWQLRLATALLVIFAACTIAAMITYGGGSWYDAHATRFSLAHNYYCDQFDAVSISGRDNVASRCLAKAALVLLCASLAAMWLAVPRALGAVPRRRALLLRFCQITGLASALTMWSVIVPAFHLTGIFIAGPLGVVSLVGINWFVWSMALPAAAEARDARRAARLVKVTGLILVATALVGLVDYVGIVFGGAPRTIVLPLAQRLGGAAIIAWVASILYLMRVLSEGTSAPTADQNNVY